MELSDVVRRRRMVRAYQPERPVPSAALARLLDHATRGPSAGFSQGQDFVVLVEEADRNRFWTAATPSHSRDRHRHPGDGEQCTATTPPTGPDPWLRGMRSAPTLVVCLSDPQRYLDRYAEPDKGWTDRDPARWPVPYWDVDTGMAAMLMLLTAVDEGLGACFFGVPPQQQTAVLEALDAPLDRRIVGVVSVGFPTQDRRSPSLRRGRRPLSETVHTGRFGRPFIAAPAAAGR